MKEEIKSLTLTYKDARIAFFWKCVEYTGLLLFLALIPRMMGPQLYGDFALLLSIIVLLVFSNALGGMPTFGRFIPEFKVKGEIASIRGVFTQFIILRLILAAPVILFFLGLNSYFQWVINNKILISLSLTYIFGIISLSCYQLFYGLNKMGRYLFHGSSTRILLVFLLLIYGGAVDIEKASYMLVGVELFLSCVLVFFARKYFSLAAAIKYSSSFYSQLSFGLAFFVSNFLLMLIWRSGEAIISLYSVGSEQVAFYNLSNSMFLAINALFAQVGTILLPSINAMHSLGDSNRRDDWLGGLFTYTVVLSFVVLIAINSIGAFVFELLLGGGYSEAFSNFKVLSICLLPLSVIRLGQTVALVHSRPKDNFLISLITLFVFSVSVILLTEEYGAFGVSLSVVMAFFASSFFSYYHFNLSEVLKVTDLGKVVGVGCFCLGIIELSVLPKEVTGSIVLLTFIVLMFLMKIINRKEISRMFKKDAL